MPADSATQLGTVLLVLLTLLSAYLLILKIREHLREQPDPKLTYATLAQHEKLRQQLVTLQRDNRHDIERFRTEYRADHLTLDNKRSTAIASVHELIRKNAEHIAALIAENRITRQRLAELTLKTDKLLERTSQP